MTSAPSSLTGGDRSRDNRSPTESHDILTALPRHSATRSNTGSRVGVSLGYKDAEGWTTEGWWNVSARSCETLLRGALVARYYYIYAVDYDRGGEWSGHAYMCSREKEFTIRSTENCLRQFSVLRMVNSFSREHI